MKSVSWNVKVHDSEGSSPYIHAETRVESLKLPNWNRRRLGQATTSRLAMRSIFQARSHGPKLLPDYIKGDAQRILRISPKAGLFQANCPRAYSDVRERRKNTFPETEKVFSPSLQGLPKSPDRQKGKRESVGKPTLSTGCYACPMFGHSIDGSRSSPSELQWIDSSDKGRSCKDERWQ